MTDWLETPVAPNPPEASVPPEAPAPAPDPAADLAAQLAAAEQRAAWAMARVGELQAELHRLHEWRRVTVGGVVAVALAAILMFGIVAFKAIDSGDADPQSGAAATTVLS